MHAVFISSVSGSIKQADYQQATTNFGLISRPYDSDAILHKDPARKSPTQWQRLAHQIETLNRESGPEVSYKLLFLGRHGEGIHNVAERRYGTAAWDVRPPSINCQNRNVTNTRSATGPSSTATKQETGSTRV